MEIISKYNNILNKNNLLYTAIEEANKALGDKRHGAILFSNKSIISKGHNEYNIDKNTLHAEECCFKEYNINYYGHNILIIRINTNKKLLNSKPCKQCVEILKKYGVKKIYYSDENQNIVMEKTNNIKTDFITSGQKYKFSK